MYVIDVTDQLWNRYITEMHICIFNHGHLTTNEMQNLYKD